MRGEPVFYFGHVDGPAELGLQRRHAFIRNPARHDEVEEVDVGRDVEGKAVARDPPRNPHANRADLFLTNPRAAETHHAPGREAVVRADADHHLFEIAHVLVHVAAIGIEIDYRISDEL